jgi:AraC-like DNA-binding protein
MARHDSIPLADPGNLRPVVRFLEAEGVPYASDLDAVHVPIESVETGRGKISKLQLFEVLDRWRLATSEDFGYRAGSHFTPSLMGGIGALMTQAPTLAEAIRRLDDHLRAWVSDNYVRVERNGSRAFLQIATRDGLDVERTVANQITVHALVNIIRLVGGPTWTPRKVWVEFSRHPIDERSGSLWGAEVVFDAVDTTVEFPAHFLALRPDSRGYERAGTVPEPPGDAVSDQVRQVVDACLGFSAGAERSVLPPPTLPELAHLVGASARTLQRRLAEEGAEYRRIVSDVRFERARYMLGVEAIPAAELATLLGYTSKSAFLRAFRRYTGMTPSEYRYSLAS